MAPKSDGHAKTDGHGKVRWSAPKSDGLLEIHVGIPKPMVTLRSHGLSPIDTARQSPTVEHAKVRRSEGPPFVYAPLYSEVERKNIKVYDVTSRDRYCYVNNNNFISRILRWIGLPSRRGIFFEKVRKTEEVESIFVYLFVGIG